MKPNFDDMKANQANLAGVSSVNVKADASQMANAVTIPGSELDQVNSVNASFVKDAPNLKFNLPFGLGRLFGLPGETQDEEMKDAQSKQK